MKTLPIITLGYLEKQNIILRGYLKFNQFKTNKALLIKIPEQKSNIVEILIEKDNTDFSEKIKKFNEEVFGENFLNERI